MAEPYERFAPPGPPRTDIQLYDGGPPRFYAQFTFALQFTSTGKSTALLYFWLRQNHRH